ncbi:MAG TPA: response regulator transcription factor [Pseudogracilibacillus sp.]|nr:response regulator transcription factor [Pseudogracilibacillus sp.]
MKLAIVDNQDIFREGLHRLFEAESDLEVIASNNSFSKLDKKEIEQIDLLLIEIDLLIEERSLINEVLFSDNSNKKIVALSSEISEEDTMQAVLAGCHGLLLKEMSYKHFIQAVRMIHEQGAYIHPQLLHYVVTDYRKLSKDKNKLVDGASNSRKNQVCTKREHEILQLLVNGHDNVGIAKELEISEKTVKNHLTNIFRKLNVKDRTQAAVLAIRNDWVTL